MARTLRRIFSDIARGRNIEAYAAVLAGIVLIAVDLIGSVEISTQLTIILFALTILVFRATTPPEERLDLDQVLSDRESYGPFREFVKGAQAVWVYAPSGATVLGNENFAHIQREVLARGGELRVLVQDPTNAASIGILSRQLDNNSDLLSDINTSLTKLQTWAARSSVQYGVLPYSPGFSLVIVNPEKGDGKLTVEFFGFQGQMITERMHIEIRRAQSQHWFEYWVGQYKAMWAVAQPTSGASAGQ